MQHDFADLAVRLGLPAEKDVVQLSRNLSALLGGQPVELRRIPAAPGRPCGRSFVTWSGDRVIEYTAHINEGYERHNVLHEIGHFLIGDLDLTPGDARLRGFSGLDPAAVARVFQRAPSTVHTSGSEEIAEAFASFADAVYIKSELLPDLVAAQPTAGVSGPGGAAHDGDEERHTQRALDIYEAIGPMWSRMTSVCPSVVLPSNGPTTAVLWSDPIFRLARRVTEILDSLDILARRFDPAVRDRAARLAPLRDPSSALYAAVIDDAIQAEIEGRPLPAAPMERSEPQVDCCFHRFSTLLAVASAFDRLQ